MSNEGFKIALPSLDDDYDSEENLFSYPAPKFGHPAKASSVGGTHPSTSTAGLPTSASAESVATPWSAQQYSSSGHARGMSTTSSDAYHAPSGSTQYGRKDSVAASNTSGEMPSWMGFGADRKASIAASQYSAGGDNSPSAFSQARKDSVASTSFVPPKQVQKKGSFVSLKSAFTKATGSDKSSSKTPAVPPLPDSAYPALRNPFTRAASSAQGSTSTPPTSFAPPTGKNRSRRPSLASSINQALTHHHGPQHYSTASSTFAFGSNSSIASPPPLPASRRNLQGSGQYPTPNHAHSLSNVSNSFANSTTGQISLSAPSTPPQYAIHLLLLSFQEITASHIQLIVSANDYLLRRGDPVYSKMVGPGADKDLDRVLESLGMAAALGGGGPKPPGGTGGFGQRQGPAGGPAPGDAKFVVDYLVKWRNQLLEEEIESGTIRSHLNGLPNFTVADVERKLNERIAMATMYVLLRAILRILHYTPSKENLGEAQGIKMEEMLWRYVTKEGSMETLRKSENKVANRKLLLEVIGKLTNLRFLTMSDRFLVELRRGVSLGSSSAGGNLSKSEREVEAKLELVIRGMEHFQLRVYPPSEFDIGSEFLVEIAGYFAQTHGATLKTAYAEIILKIIHPIANTATAEVNHPQWAKAISIIYAQAQKMLKDKYWHVGYPLAVVALCVSPRETFKEHWMDLITSGLAKMKERPHARPVVANAIMRLVWVYLNRCTEESSAGITKNLDSIVQVMFPARQRLLNPSDVSLDVFTAILHFILVRQFDYGRELVFQLLSEDRYGEGGRASSTAVSDYLSNPERMTVAIRAVLLTLQALEKDIRTPSFPTSCDFSATKYGTDYPSSGDALSDAVLSKPGLASFVDRLNPILTNVALLADRHYGSASLFDDAYSVSRNRSADIPDGGSSVVEHVTLRCRIKNDLRPSFNLLRSIFDAWPRILRFSIGIGKTLEIFARGIAHVDPDVTVAATAALNRIASGTGKAEAVAAGYARFLTSSKTVVRAHQVGVKAYENEVQRLVQLWVDIIDIWLADLQEVPPDDRLPVSEESLAQLESTALFCLASVSASLRKLAIVALQKIGQVQDHSAVSDDPSERVISFLESAGQIVDPSSIIPAAALSSSETLRLESFSRPVPADFILQWADSGNSMDEHLWYLCYPQVVQRLQLRAPDAMRRFRSLVGRMFLDWKSNIAETARKAANGPAPRSALTTSSRTSTEHLLSEQWRIFVTVLCATTTPTGDISAAASKLDNNASSTADLEAERLSSSKHLFQQIMHFLYSENALFRDAAVTALGHIAQPTLNDLLETLGRITSHIYDSAQPTPRIKPMTPTQTRVPHPENTDLYTAAAHVFERISPLIKDTRSLGDLHLMRAIIQFVDRTLRYLTDRADNPHLHPLRRYFCIVVQNLADGVAIAGDPERHLGREFRASIFKQCDEWSNLGRRTEVAQARESRLLSNIDDSLFNSRDRSAVIASVSNHGKQLSAAAANAMAALCQGPIFLVSVDSRPSPGPSGRGVEASGILQWIRSLFTSGIPSSHEVGGKALSSLLKHNGDDPTLVKEVLQQTFGEGDHLDLPRSFFGVVVSALVGRGPPSVAFAQQATLVLIKLAHPDISVRRRALDLLSISVLPESPYFARFYPTVGSSAPTIYLRAQREIAEKLADLKPAESVGILSELTLRLTQVDATRRSTLLRLFPPFVTRVDCGDSAASRVVLTDILFIAVQFGNGYPEEMQQIWLSLACGPHPRNCSEIVKFLLQQASRRSSLDFVVHARHIVANLSSSSVGHSVFEDLCAFIEPAAMVQTPDFEERTSSSEVTSVFEADLDSLFPVYNKAQAISTGRLALLFVGEMMTDRADCSDSGSHLPALLHATFTQVDHLYAPIREQAQALLFQILWTWTSEEQFEDWESLKEEINALWNERHTLFWGQDAQVTDELNIPRKMTTLVPRILDILEPSYPELRHVWGALAVDWGTSCPDRQLACRSFQLFRVLSPQVTPRMLADMIGRLSNTLANSTPGNNIFCQELLWGFCSIVRSMETENLLAFPQIFWCAAACLSTTVEEEFSIALDFLALILDRLDLNESTVVDILLEHQPPHWSEEDLRLQALLLPGLRSSVTDQKTFDLMCRLAAVEGSALIDLPEDRTMHLFVASLPWCLIAMEDDDFSPEIIALAEDLGYIAASEGKPGIERLMQSFAKNRFRTKDDFLRGAVSSIREYYLSNHAFDVVTSLLGFVLNSRDWMREKTLLLLKLVFQSPEAKEPLAIYGSELLMPLLRLVKSDLAPQALEVLAEPMNVSGGLAAAQVLRMSMTFGAVMHNLAANSGEVFGPPLESGWCIAKADEKSASACQNALAVFETCPQGARIQSSAHFSMQFQDGMEFYPNDLQGAMGHSSMPSQAAEEITLGELVGDLHSLNQFFDDIDDDEEILGSYSTMSRNTSVPESIGAADSAAERRLADVLRRSARTPSISSIREFESRRVVATPTFTSPFPPSSAPPPETSSPASNGSSDSLGPPGNGLPTSGRGSDADRRPSHQKDGLQLVGDGFESDPEGGRSGGVGGKGALDRAFGVDGDEAD